MKVFRVAGLPSMSSERKEKKGQRRIFVLFHPDSYPNFYRFLNHKFLMMSFHFGSRWRYNGELMLMLSEEVPRAGIIPLHFSPFVEGKSFQKLKREHLWGNVLVIWESKGMSYDELFLPSIKRYAQVPVSTLYGKTGKTDVITNQS